MDLKLKRGIDLQNRVWESGVGKHFKKASKWWDGGPMNRFTAIGLFIVFVFNAILVSSLFGKNIATAFSTSTLLLFLSNIFSAIGISQNLFFTTLSFLCLLFAPISVYLFARRIAHRHEATAFIAALLFVIPSPFSSSGMPLISAIFAGDGAFALIFSFVPLFLLYFKAFIANGVFLWGFLSAIGIAFIAIASPFAFINVFLLCGIITISEGFLGGFRIKILRFGAVLLFAFGLSYFWYHPHALTQIVVLDGVKYGLSYLWHMFPLLIPTVPTVGAISFLIFDRREKLQPVFIALSMCGIYFLLSYVSSSSQMSGIFLASRFESGIIFSLCMLLSLICGFLSEIFYQRAKEYMMKKSHNIKLLHVGLAIVAILVGVGIMLQTFSVRDDLSYGKIMKPTSIGAGNIQREGNGIDSIAVVASFVSIATFVFMIYLLKQYPPPVVKNEFEVKPKA